MISFRKLGEYGRLGNQLFQYAYVRSQAQRMGVKFYCPKWAGDDIFELQDEQDRTDLFESVAVYGEGDYLHGFNPNALDIKDGTDVEGYFQSEKYFKKEDVQKWFAFKKEKIREVEQKYKDVDFENSTAIHLRLGDYLHPSLQFYTAKLGYFKEALALVPNEKNILVFSDDPELAKKFLAQLAIDKNMLFMEGNRDYEDLYLVTRCKNVICSASSFSWWGAYLNQSSGKVVVMPSKWFLPGCPTQNKDIFVSGWKKLSAHRWNDHYLFRYFPIKIRSAYRKLTTR